MPEEKNDEKKTAKKAEKEAGEQGGAKRACKVKGCKRPYRAKGYCVTHYKKWRQGELPKTRYKTCNHGVKKLKHGEKKECLKRVFRSGLCEEHYKASRAVKSAEATPAAATPAAAPAT